MQEINDHIIKNLYNDILVNTPSKGDQTREEIQFQKTYMDLAEWVTPLDFDIPEAQINEFNMPIWNKAIKELQNIERFPTPRQKLKYLLNSIKIVNNSFSLFTSSKENIAASADDMLSIFPYIVLKAKISRLLRQIKFIKIFEYQEL